MFERIVRWHMGHIMTNERKWHYCSDWASDPKVLTQQRTQHTINLIKTIYYYFYVFNTLNSFSVVYHISYSYVLTSINIKTVYQTQYYEERYESLIHAEAFTYLLGKELIIPLPAEKIELLT